MPLNDLLETLTQRSLDQDESYLTFTGLIEGELSEVEIAALLAALKIRGETPAEIAGAARALREAAVEFPKPSYPVGDTCGTGGDGAGTINVSTAAAFVAAAGGLAIAKHGNRAASSRSGSADLLEALGVRLDPPPAQARQALDEIGLCFLFAPAYHPGVRRAMSVRRALKTRTLFNLLGPLANPAAPEFQLMGIYDPRLCRPMAETLGLLGCQAALVVHGSGLDEIALHAETRAALLTGGAVTELVLTPEDLGFPRVPLPALAGAGPEASGVWLRRLLAGEGAPAHRAAVAVNAGAMLWIAGRAPSLPDGAAVAAGILDRGAAYPLIDRLIELSHGA